MATVINSPAPMNDIAYQMELDLATDRARLEKLDWRRAIEEDLRAIRDYIHPHQLIIWRPGERRGMKAQEVHLVTNSMCTCQRFALRDRCQHIEFARHLERESLLPGPDSPVAAREM